MKKLIELTKRVRSFKAEHYLAKKIILINNFFRENNLDSCVIGISGGVDSAVVFKLMLMASLEPHSPIKKVLGLTLPIYTEGITGQYESVLKSYSLMKSCENYFAAMDFQEHNLSNACEALFTKEMNEWTKGQLACIVRTPKLYGTAALLQQQGYNSLVVGTTNRDEGSYIGFFGKASDAMVDLQPIADLHKSEVYALAKELEIPEAIINATPKGDVWDGKVDEQMIGAPYWFLEMYLISKQLVGHFKLEFEKLYKELSIEDEALFYKYSMAIEKIHEKNAHKYAVGNPAHFIDVMKRTVKGGW